MEPNNPFADIPVIYSYTRAQALKDGVLVDVSKLATEAGFTVPTVVTQAVWSDCCEWTAADDKAKRRFTGQSATGRTWDVVWMAHYSIQTRTAPARATPPQHDSIQDRSRASPGRRTHPQRLSQSEPRTRRQRRDGRHDHATARRLRGPDESRTGMERERQSLESADRPRTRQRDR